MRYWTKCHWSATDAGLWETRKCCFVNSSDLCEGKQAGALVRENHGRRKHGRFQVLCLHLCPVLI